MVAATKSTNPAPVQTRPDGSSSPPSAGSSASGALKGALRGQSFAVQESALAPREKKRGEAPVQRLAAGGETPTPTTEPVVAPEESRETPASADETGAPGPLQARLETWRPALVKATDPVAFMNEKSYVAAMKTGKDAAAGFYAQAIGELDRLAAEMAALSAGEAELAAGERGEVDRLVALAGAWASLYATIRDTGDNPADRDGLTAVALGAVRGAQSQLDGLSPALIGAPAIARMNQSLDDIRTFVASWSVLAESDSGASKAMWASFLQTTERYRMIMAEYGALEERGGDASGTGQLAVKGEKGMAKTREEADQAADASGGYMVLAMQTYSYKAANQAGMQKQIEAMAHRVFAGEFKSLDEATRAGRQEIGGGRCSEVYYREVVDHYIGKAWETYSGTNKNAAVELKTGQAEKLLAEARESEHRSDKALKGSKEATRENREHAQGGLLEASDRAWDKSTEYRRRAELYLQQAEAYVGGANARLDDATRLYAEAVACLESAKNHGKFLDPQRHPELAAGLEVIDAKLGKLEKDLGTSEERLGKAQLLRDEIALRAEAQRQALDQYAPEKMEVEVPEALLRGSGSAGEAKGGADKSELKSFVKGKLSVDAKIGSIISINGSTECEGGVKQKKGAQWGYLKNDWSLGMSIDLVLFALKAAYVAGSEVEAKDKLTPPEVMAAGEKERSRYAAKRQIFESKSADKLAAAFEKNQAALSQTFSTIKTSAEDLRAKKLGRAMYRMRVLDGALAAKEAQHELWAGIVGSFLGVSNLWDALAQAHAVLDEKEVYDRVLELAEASARSAPEEVQARGTTIMQANEDARLVTKRPMDEINDHSNNLDVSFKDYGGWEFGAEVGGAGFSVSAKVKWVTVTSDGEEDTYDYEDHSVRTVSASFSSREFKGDVSGEWKDGSFKKLSLSGTLAYDGKFDDPKRKTIEAKASKAKEKFNQAIAAIKDAKNLANKMKDLFQEFFSEIATALKSHRETEKWEAKTAATPQIMVGFDFKFGDKTEIVLRVGAGMKVEDSVKAGAFTIKGEVTTGTEASIPLN